MTPLKTALIIFAQSAKTDALKKAHCNAISVFETLNNNTFKKATQTGLPYFIFDETKQIGNSFAERYVNAISSIIDQGYSNIITIGTDTPQLTATTILKAAEQITPSKMVIGPSLDGGFYLLGFNARQFNKKTFLQLPWLTSKLTNAICNSFNANFAFLNALRDIDKLEQFAYFSTLKNQISTRLIKILLQLIPKRSISSNLVTLSFKNCFIALLFNKGSPAVI